MNKQQLVDEITASLIGRGRRPSGTKAEGAVPRVQLAKVLIQSVRQLGGRMIGGNVPSWPMTVMAKAEDSMARKLRMKIARANPRGRTTTPRRKNSTTMTFSSETADGKDLVIEVVRAESMRRG